MSDIRYYLKEVLSRPLRTKSQIAIPWNDAGDDCGWLETNDPRLIAELDAAVAKRIGGVRSVTKEDVIDAKKKASERQSFIAKNGPHWSGSPRIDNQSPFPTAKRAGSGEDPGRQFDPSIPMQNTAAPEPVGAPLEIPSNVPAAKRQRAPKPKAVTADEPAQ